MFTIMLLFMVVNWKYVIEFSCSVTFVLAFKGIGEFIKMLLPATFLLGYNHCGWQQAAPCLSAYFTDMWTAKAVKCMACAGPENSCAAMFQDCVSCAGVAVVCDGHSCLHLVVHSQLPSILTLPVRSICLVWGRLLLLRHLVYVPSTQQPWHEWSQLSLGSTQGLPNQTAGHCASSLVHRFLWILSHCGECRWSSMNWFVCFRSQVHVTYVWDWKLNAVKCSG